MKCSEVLRELDRDKSTEVKSKDGLVFIRNLSNGYYHVVLVMRKPFRLYELSKVGLIQFLHSVNGK